MSYQNPLILSITNTTDSTNTSTGSLQVLGGGSITKSLFVGSIINQTTSTYNDAVTAASSTLSQFSYASFNAPTITATNTSVTTTNAATLFISGSPVASTNETITNGYALQVNSGASLFGGSLTGSGIVTLSNSTSVGNTNPTSTGSGSLNVTGDISINSRIFWNSNVGIGPPTFTTRSSGTRIVLFPVVGGSSVDYAIGISTNTLWFSTASTSQFFRWYAGTTNVMTLDGTGNLSTTSNVSAPTITSTVSTGTAPFTVSSTTNVANLNASSLSGATFSSPGSIGNTTASSGAFTTLSTTGATTLGYQGASVSFLNFTRDDGSGIINMNLAGTGTGTILTIVNNSSGIGRVQINNGTSSYFLFSSSGSSTTSTFTISNTTTSTSSSTGALVLSAGGLGISNTTDATSSSNGGACTIAGGLAIAKTLQTGGPIITSGTITTSGNLILTSSVITLTGATLSTGSGSLGQWINAGTTSSFNDNVTAASGTNSTFNAAYRFGNHTYNASNTSVTMTNNATLYIDGGPTPGTNVTISNPYALYVAAGNSYLNGITFTGSAVSGVSTLSASGVITSTVSTGTAPFTVSSTTNVPNLNASSLSGATFSSPGPIGSGTASTGNFSTISASTSGGSVVNTFTNTNSSTGSNSSIRVLNDAGNLIGMNISCSTDGSGVSIFSNFANVPISFQPNFSTSINIYGNSTGNPSTYRGANLNILGKTFTDSSTAASGTNLTIMGGTVFNAQTFASSNTSVTLTNASTVYIAGAPINGTNTTITNPYALYVAAGDSYFSANVFANAFIPLFQSISNPATTTTLTASSPEFNSRIGSSNGNQIIQLPAGNTLYTGRKFVIASSQNGSFLTIKASGGTTLLSLQQFYVATFYCTNPAGTDTTTWTWSIGYNAATQPIANGGTGVVSVTTSPTATSFAGWDANLNISANNFISNYSTTATAAGTTTLTVSSSQQQYFTGSTTQTVLLPVTSTLVLGFSFTIVNNSSGVVTVQSSGANVIKAMAANSTLIVTCILITGTTAASWNALYTTESGLPDLSSPGPIGSVTPNTGVFTTLSTTGISSLNGLSIYGSTTGNPATYNGADVYHNSYTFTDSSTAASGTNANFMAGTYINSPTFSASNTTVTITNAATLYVAGAPSNGTNATITNAYTLYVAAGTSFIQKLNVGYNGGSSGIGLSRSSGSQNSALFVDASNNLNITNSDGSTGDINISPSQVSIVKGRVILNNVTVIGNSNLSMPTTTSNTWLKIGGAIFQDQSTIINGTLSAVYGTYLAQTTFNTSNTGTTTTLASTLYIAGAPIAGTNTTISNPYALYVNDGIIYSGCTTQSSSNTTGSLLLSGGIAINSTIDAASYTNGGSFTTGGGMGIGKSLRVGYRMIIYGNNISGNPATFNGAQLYLSSQLFIDTLTAASGTNSSFMAGSYLNAPTFASNNTSVTTTNASTVYISGAPINGTNVTITNPYALYVAAGNSYLNGITFTGSAVSGVSTLSASGVITSTVSTGTAPFTISSTTNIPNLNASSLSGNTFANPGSIGSGTPSSGAFTTLSTTGGTTLGYQGDGVANLGFTRSDGVIGININLTGVATATMLTITNASGSHGRVGFNNGTSTYFTFDSINGSSTTVTNTSTSPSTGALILSAGGLGINNTTDATSSSNGGACSIGGGLAIAKQLFVGTSVTANVLVSTVSTGTAPFTVSSTTNVPNLNASSLNGNTFASPSSIGSGTASTGAFTNITATASGAGTTGIIMSTANSTQSKPICYSAVGNASSTQLVTIFQSTNPTSVNNTGWIMGHGGSTGSLSTTDGALGFYSGAFGNDVMVLGYNGVINMYGTTASTSYSTGALLLPNGGLGISLTTDAVSSSNGGACSIGGGLAVGKNAYIGSNVYANNNVSSYTTTATAAGTTTLTVSSTAQQFFTGTTTQTIILPDTSTLTTGFIFTIVNQSTGIITVQSSGANTIQAMAASTTATYTCILITGTGIASWYVDYRGSNDTGIFTSVSITNTTDSTSIGTGAEINSGGLSVAKNSFLGNVGAGVVLGGNAKFYSYNGSISSANPGQIVLNFSSANFYGKVTVLLIETSAGANTCILEYSCHGQNSTAINIYNTFLSAPNDAFPMSSTVTSTGTSVTMNPATTGRNYTYQFSIYLLFGTLSTIVQDSVTVQTFNF